jgi:hypothetical protein
MDKETRDQLTIARFEAADINPTTFDHEAHIYVAWQYIGNYARNDAIARFDAALQRLTEKIGATKKYNAMITWLFLLLIAERVQAGENWPAFRARNADLFEDLPRIRAA